MGVPYIYSARIRPATNRPETMAVGNPASGCLLVAWIIKAAGVIPPAFFFQPFLFSDLESAAQLGKKAVDGMESAHRLGVHQNALARDQVQV